MKSFYAWNLLLLVTGLGIPATGCRSIGPATISRDRLDYGEAVAESWKQQMLRNLVRLRYADAPVFLDLGQIVSGYSWERGVTLSGQLAKTGQGDEFLGAEVSGTLTDRPTMTYTPLTGEKFLRGLIEPVQPGSVFHLMQSGYSTGLILELAVDSLNGLRNRRFQNGKLVPADPDFLRVRDLFTDIQSAGALQVYTEEDETKKLSPVLALRSDDIPDDVRDKIAELKRLLRLNPELNHFWLAQARQRLSPQELAVGSRSFLQMLVFLSTFVDVPDEDIQKRRAVAIGEPSADAPAPIHIRSSSSRPREAFSAVRYHDRWFWIDDGDFRSKQTLTTVLFLFTLTDAGDRSRAPVLTIPAN